MTSASQKSDIGSFSRGVFSQLPTTSYLRLLEFPTISFMFRHIYWSGILSISPQHVIGIQSCFLFLSWHLLMDVPEGQRSYKTYSFKIRWHQGPQSLSQRNKANHKTTVLYSWQLVSLPCLLIVCCTWMFVSNEQFCFNVPFGQKKKENRYPADNVCVSLL